MTLNARIIEKNILADVLATQGGDSEVVDLFGQSGGAKKFSCQAVYDVQAPAAKTFTGPLTAEMTDQTVTYTANEAGAAGNDITIELIDTGVPGEPFAIDVTDSAIAVTLEVSTGDAASKTNQGVTYTANEIGEDGNDITITIILPTDPDIPLDVAVSGTDITITLGTDDLGASESTATDVVTAVNLDAQASLLVTASGAGALPLIGWTIHSLEGGTDPIADTDIDTLVFELNDDPASSALITASGTGSDLLVALAPTNLEDGSDGDINVADNEITITAHGYTTGFKIQLTTTGTLPAPFLTGTNYFIIVIDENTIQLAATLADALAGEPVVLEDMGTDDTTDTVTGVALSGASFTFKKSNDASTWINIQAATTVTIDGSVLLEVPVATYRYFKVTKAITSGQVDLQALTLVIGDAE